MAGLFHSRKVINRGMPLFEGANRRIRRMPPLDDIKWPNEAFLRSLPLTEITKLGISAWRFTWNETTAPYTIYLNGVFMDVVSVTEWEADLLEFPDFPPPIEIIDANGTKDLVNTFKHPPYAQLQWFGDPSATNYYVEEKTGSASFTRRQIVNENGQGYHLFQTPTLLEGINDWRVIPVDFIGNEGTPIDFSFNIVPPPLPPNAVPITYGGGLITVGP